MGEVDRARLKVALSRHYAAQRSEAAGAGMDALVTAMLAEDARMCRADTRQAMGMPSFVAAQVRYIPAWTWAAQIACVAAMVWLACSVGDADPVRWVVGALSALSVLVCVPTLHASRRHGVAELEYSCCFDATGVLVARLVVMGCSCSLVVALMVAGTSAATGLGALDVALWACPPYFLSCAGSLALMRRVRPDVAAVACFAWAALCCGALLMLGHACPDAYAASSLGTWAFAAALALAWLVREAALTVRSAAAGLDSFAPQLANTYN